MIEVTLAYAPAPRQVFEQTVLLPKGATVGDAVRASTLTRQFPLLDWRAMTPGVWGKAAAWDGPLAHLDRVELCRALTVDPKVARRERFQRQGAGATGLFKHRREGGKAGY
ncbi:RnfH family protein [Variovorax ginsengisoli]|uniref:UPF0125 protein J2W36_004042 n=1 Tax=Variovorax ginsengisoli TaxID=363844 RepID=A0ABT9SEH3_9BURK|nr:RnfH family protein [Variovorax ginsengisoli]MDP9901772.1 putative ubiquitin-RnfH superfamily antitoxin RatB of RatAB toxin-antitoxin module [Variovorax ginsengisoli]